MATLAPTRQSHRWRRPTNRTVLAAGSEDSFFHGAIVALPFGFLLWSCLIWAIHAAI